MVLLQKLEAWEYDPDSVDHDERSEHRYCPNRPVPPQTLQDLGVLHWKIDVEDYDSNHVPAALEAIKQERRYIYWETITVAPGELEGYDAKLARFFTEHLHPYDESRLILDGSGFWDIRGYNGEWIRFRVGKGDMIVLPPGMYHRFTIDTNNYIKALLLFTEVPSRIDMLKPQADELQARKEYVKNVLMIDFSATSADSSSSSAAVVSDPNDTLTTANYTMINNHLSTSNYMVAI